MPKYKCTVMDDYGKKLEGVLEAENEKGLEEHLASKGYYLLNAEEMGEVRRVEPSPQESPLSRESPKKPRKLKKWLAIGLGSFGGLLLLLFIVGLFLPESRTDFRNEPDGFRGIKWGANVKDIPTMVFVSEERDIEDIPYVKTYKRKNDELYVDGVCVKGIRYDFVLINREYKFGAVFISFEGESNFKKIKEMLDSKHGKGNQFYNNLEEYYWWSWSNTHINLRKVSKNGDEGELCYFSSQMARKSIKE